MPNKNQQKKTQNAVDNYFRRQVLHNFSPAIPLIFESGDYITAKTLFGIFSILSLIVKQHKRKRENQDENNAIIISLERELPDAFVLIFPAAKKVSGKTTGVLPETREVGEIVRREAIAG